MRKISATYIFPGNQPPLKNGILVCTNTGKIIELIDTGGKLEEQPGLEQYSGILVPGFVNAHCHLELSHLKGKIPEKTGTGGFVGAVKRLRNEEPEAAQKANRSLQALGRVAVGDVSNSTLTLNYLPAENQLFLVHNSFTNESDILELKKQRATENTFFVLCPNSNLYIENALPLVPLFQKHGLNICLGTDSLASKQKLSILAEMITLQQHFPEITLEKLVLWSTFNGAKALQVENRFGSFEPGKQPGVNLITGADLKNLKLTDKCQVKKLI